MKNVFTTYEIATLCNVDIGTVINWIDSGKLVAYKTPGGHRRINKEDFLRFLKAYQLPIPRGLSVSGIKAVVVDDDDELREFVAEIIKNKWPDAEIYEADDGFLAGKIIAERQPSLIVLDLKLPGVDGLQVCRLIRADRRLKDSKIIAVTAFHSKELCQKVLNAGADDYLVKPFAVEDIIKSFDRLFPPEEALS